MISCPLQPAIAMLRDRLFHAQGGAAAGPQPPNSFNRVSTAKPVAAAHASAPKAQVMVGNYCLVSFFCFFFLTCNELVSNQRHFSLVLRVNTSPLLPPRNNLLCHQFTLPKLLQPVPGPVYHLRLVLCRPVQPALS